MNDTLKAAGRIGAELGAAKAEVERLRGLLTQALEFTEANTCGGPDVAQLIAEMRAALSQQAEPSELGQGSISRSWRQAVIEAHAEPTDTYTATDMINQSAQAFRDGQAAVEQAAAQDEQQPVAIANKSEPAPTLRASVDLASNRFEAPITGWPVPAQEERKTFEVEIPDISAIYDGRSFIPYRSLEAGERLMTVAQHLRIEKQLRAALTSPAQTEQQPVGWIHEDELPEGYPYDAMFPFSKVDVVRMFPVYAPIAQTAPQQNVDAGLLGRIDAAIKAFTSGKASMHVPPEPTDVDMVLGECRQLVKGIIAAPQSEQINIDPLLNAGAALSNIAFNLAQRPGVTLDQHVCDLLSSARKRWDAARAALSAQGAGDADS